NSAVEAFKGREFSRHRIVPYAWATIARVCGGEGEIRTHERVAPLAVFKTAALNHSATSPCRPQWAMVILNSRVRPLHGTSRLPYWRGAAVLAAKTALFYATLQG